MIKNSIVFLLTFLFSVGLTAQNTVKIYDPSADAKKEIAIAVQKAAEEGKHVFIQVGGNWCPWCIKFNKFTTENTSLDSLVKASFIVVHLNYSKENENTGILASYNYPQRFGFPVFLILDEKGNLIHTQDSGDLEEEKSYSFKKVDRFFRMWSPLTMQQAKQKYGKEAQKEKK